MIYYPLSVSTKTGTESTYTVRAESSIRAEAAEKIKIEFSVTKDV